MMTEADGSGIGEVALGYISFCSSASTWYFRFSNFSLILLSSVIFPCTAIILIDLSICPFPWLSLILLDFLDNMICHFRHQVLQSRAFPHFQPKLNLYLRDFL